MRHHETDDEDLRLPLRAVVVDGEELTRDVIVLQGVVRNWWRSDGHRMVREDLSDVWNELPERLVVGTGAAGRMEPDPVALERCAHGASRSSAPTERAVERFGELRPRVGGRSPAPPPAERQREERAGQRSLRPMHDLAVDDRVSDPHVEDAARIDIGGREQVVAQHDEVGLLPDRDRAAAVLGEGTRGRRPSCRRGSPSRGRPSPRGSTGRTRRGSLG